MKKTLLIIAAIAAAAYVIISAVKGTFNPMNWFASGTPADGTPCTMSDNTAGQYKNGICIRRIDIVPSGETVIRTPRRTKCYIKPAGSSCARQIFDSVLGWGTLYSQTSTSCCYIF